jgi:DNA repair protein RadD
MVTLRPYQETAVADIRAAFSDHRRVLFCLPTGGGKTVIFSFIVHQVSSRAKRIYIIAHRIEIIRQISKALTRQGVAHGIVSPDDPQTADMVQVCMIQTLNNRLAKLPRPDLLVIDESHHIVSDSYRKITDAWNTLQLGVTATPERLDGKGLGDCFDTLVQGPSARTLIDAGSLCDFLYLAPPSELDLSEVHSRGGDYAIEELAAAVEKSQIVGDAVKHYTQYLGGKPAVAFCISVAHAEAVAERFRAAGWRAASIDGKMSKGVREGILLDLDEGRIDVLASCDLISEGFDVPEIQGVILLRPTKSLALHLQQVGRSLRPKRDGSKAVILDHVGNCLRHGLPDWDREWSLDGKVKRAKAAPIAVCSLCFQALKAPVRKGQVEDCDGASDPETGEIFPCPYLVEKPGKPRTVLQEVDGELVDASAKRSLVRGAAKKPDPLRPDWAEGLNIATAKGRDWFRLLELAGGDLDRLKEIAQAKNYKRGWAQHLANEWTLKLTTAAETIRYARTMSPINFTIYREKLKAVPTDVLWTARKKLKSDIDADVAAERKGAGRSINWSRDGSALWCITEEINNRKTRAA